MVTTIVPTITTVRKAVVIINRLKKKIIHQWLVSPISYLSNMDKSEKFNLAVFLGSSILTLSPFLTGIYI